MNLIFFTPEQLHGFPDVSLRYLEVVQKGHILTMTLNRPEKRNAFNPLMADEIAFTLEYAGLHDEIRCLVVKAAGPVFCAGADLASFAGNNGNDTRSVPVPRHPVNLGDAFASLHKPSIAQIEGPVLAGGFLILAGVTFAYAVPEARFSLPEVKRGLWPMQVMASLSKILPSRRVLEMCITAKTYSSGEALDMGLLSRVAGKDDIEKEIAALASEIAQNAPLAISRGMETFQSLPELPTSLTYRRLQEELNKLLESEDAAEGINAFLEKRTPVWKNR